VGLFNKITKVANVADEYVETGQERQATLTSRHLADMQSDNWLAKAIRPLSLLLLLSTVVLMSILSSFGYEADPIIFGELSVLLGSAFGFYFDSRKREKIASQKAKAAIEIQKMKTKQEIKKERKMLRQDRRRKRRERRDQDG